MSIELTTICPLRCPQCYCSFTREKYIDLKTAVHWIKEAGKNGVKTVMLGGGETLCYPHLFDVIEAANKYCGTSNIALSGFGFTQDVFDKLMYAEVSSIFISLNGSTEAINMQTRDGFNLAISALDLLNKNKFNDTWINWVMHSNNSHDFLNVVEIAEKYNVKNISVIGFKPDSKGSLSSIPSKSQMLNVKRMIENYKGSVKIIIESCYSPMLALMLDTKLFGNLNISDLKGCAAGRYTSSVNVDGDLSPCKHLNYFEKYSNFEDYWSKSEVLQKIRGVEHDKHMPCNACSYSDYCRHCLAINKELNNALFIGYELCPLQY